MRILAVNCGSSSLKFALFEDDARAASGEVALGPDGTRVRFERVGSGPLIEEQHGLDHAAAAVGAARWLRSEGLAPEAVGHRVVHGGTSFATSTLIDDAALATLEELTDLAPLHNAPALAAMRALRDELGPEVPVTASFDTAFHRTMPDRASRYAIPSDLAERHGLWRFGFHGLAHQALARGAAQFLGQPLEELRLITLQLGSGCSAAAINGGRSIDTSMGLTPLEGLVMGTRSGDVDPSLAGVIATAEGIDHDEAVALLNRESGLLGVSSRSADVRELLDAEEAGDAQAALALEMFCYRVRKQVGAYLAALEGADAIVFGGGIGEHAAEVRARIGEPLDWAGLDLDRPANEAVDLSSGAAAEISGAGSTLQALVVALDEEALIAADCRALLEESA